MTHQNTPYVKIYNEKGILTNPITKHKPYVSSPQNRKARRDHLQRRSSSGIQMVILSADFRYKERKQLIVDNIKRTIKVITHYDLK